MPPTESFAQFDRYVKSVTLRAIGLAAGLALASLAWRPAGAPVALGIALGGGAGIVSFRRRARSLIRFANADEGRRKAILIRGRMESYLVAAVALALAFSLEGVHTWAAVASLFIANAVVVFTASRPSDAEGEFPNGQ